MHGLVLALIAPLLASASIVLTDGQVIKGLEVARQGDSYVVKMEGGNAITFPAALVKEVRFEDEAPPPNPYPAISPCRPGVTYRYGGPHGSLGSRSREPCGFQLGATGGCVGRAVSAARPCSEVG